MAMEELDRCCELCVTCAHVCVKALYRHCLTAGGRPLAASQVLLMTDCSEVCQMTATFMTRASPRHRQMCAVCADICDACAEDCSHLVGMADCVSACRRCAESCRAMAG